MATPNERYYFGDVRLYQHGLEHVEDPQRQVLQSFTGVDRERVLVIPASPNHGLGLEVKCFGAPNAASVTRKGLRAILRAMRELLESRSTRADPVVWVEDDSTLRVLSGVAGPLMTSANHPYVVGDRLLIRRTGAGLWSLVSVLTTPGANTFTAAAVAGTVLHALQPGDQVLLVEGYWVGMVFQAMPRVDPAEEDWWAAAISYRFLGSGTYTYARTTASVGV